MTAKERDQKVVDLEKLMEAIEKITPDKQSYVEGVVNGIRIATEQDT